MSLRLESAAFEEGYPLPARHTCEGLNISPPLSWYGVPGDARSLAIVLRDADAGPKKQVHWIIYNIPPGCPRLHERIPPMEFVEKGVRQAQNDFNTIGYTGPCLPTGAHRYFFHIYALNRMLDLPAGCGPADFQAAIEGNVLDSGILSCTYCLRRTAPRWPSLKERQS